MRYFNCLSANSTNSERKQETNEMYGNGVHSVPQGTQGFIVVNVSRAESSHHSRPRVPTWNKKKLGVKTSENQFPQ